MRHNYANLFFCTLKIELGTCQRKKMEDMKVRTIKKYTEVKLPSCEGISNHYKNPLTKTFQYEYALLTEVSNLFKETVCKSQCIDTLKMYYNELPSMEQLEAELEHSEQIDDTDNKANTECVKRTRESVREEARFLIERYVMERISFPMMSECKARVLVIPRNDGTHAFLFTDDIYAFLVRCEMIRKGHPKRIIVRSFDNNGHAADKAA